MKVKFRFTIATKLTLGFGILMLSVIITSLYNYITLRRNVKENLEVITNVYTPTSSHLNDLDWLIIRTKVLIKNWVYIDRKDDTPDKNKLREMHAREIPATERALEPLVDQWSDMELQERYRNVVQSIDSLVEMHQNIMSQLNSFEAYEDMMITFPIFIMTEEDGEVMLLTERIHKQLQSLIEKIDDTTQKKNIQMMESFMYLKNLILFMMGILVIVVIVIALITTRALVSPINFLKQTILQIGRGVLPREDLHVGSDEIGEMANAINLLVRGLKQTSEYSLRIGEGDFVSEFQPLSDQDVLGNSLMLMRENLKKAKLEEEKRKKEDQQRGWAAQGLAKFSEILRMSNDDMEEFGYRIISNLVKYVNANIGGFYILEDSDSKNIHVELLACYAYGRQKYMKKQIDVGVSVVGQCVQEKETIFMTEIPMDYVKITSGLGTDNPRSLLVVPLKMNEQVFGVVEIASFEVFEPYQIEFVEKLGESIASTISSVKVSLHTAKLLAESQEKSERLAQQEEEVRQNIEEMQATQDDLLAQIKGEKQKSSKLKEEFKDKMQRNELKLKQQQQKLTKQEIELRGTLDAINNTIGAVEFNMFGEYTWANDKYLEMTEYSFDQLSGKHHSQFMLKARLKEIGYQSFWNDLNKGISKREVFQYFFGDSEKWFRETFTPVKDENENYYKVVTLVQDITTDVKRKSKEHEEHINIPELENKPKPQVISEDKEENFEDQLENLKLDSTVVESLSESKLEDQEEASSSAETKETESEKLDIEQLRAKEREERRALREKERTERLATKERREKDEEIEEESDEARERRERIKQKLAQKRAEREKKESEDSGDKEENNDKDSNEEN